MWTLARWSDDLRTIAGGKCIRLKIGRNGALQGRFMSSSGLQSGDYDDDEVLFNVSHFVHLHQYNKYR